MPDIRIVPLGAGQDVGRRYVFDLNFKEYTPRSIHHPRSENPTENPTKIIIPTRICCNLPIFRLFIVNESNIASITQR